MSQFELPRNLVRAVEDYDGEGSPSPAWMDALPLIVDELARRWSLDPGRPFQPGGVASWVAPARNTAGERRVLKVGWRHDEGLHEPDALRLWNGDGSVLLYDAVTFGETSALLLEACEPGTPLSEVAPPEQQDVVVSDLMRRLWIDPPAGHAFRPLRELCESWAEEVRQEYAALATRPPLDPGLVRTGMELLRELPETAKRSVLLCTDLHPGNVLAAMRESWLVIDPKPYVGDPTYDALQHMLNFPGRLCGDPARFAARMAGLLDLDAPRLRLWLFARCVRESIDQPGMRNAAAALAP